MLFLRAARTGVLPQSLTASVAQERLHKAQGRHHAPDALAGDRVEAGRVLGERLATLKPVKPAVLALPRGGVLVAAETARALHALFNPLMVRMTGAPGQREPAAAAVVDGGHLEIVVDREILRLSVADRAFDDAEAEHEPKEIERCRARYLLSRMLVPLAGKSVDHSGRRHRDRHEAACRAEGAVTLQSGAPGAGRSGGAGPTPWRSCAPRSPSWCACRNGISSTLLARTTAMPSDRGR